LKCRSRSINAHASLRHREVVVKSLKTGWIIPAQFRSPIVDKVVVECLNVPRIATGTFGPNEIARGSIGVVAVIRNDRTVNRVRISRPHVLVNARGICHHEVIENVLRSAWTRERLGLGLGKRTCAENNRNEVLHLGSSSKREGRNSRRMEFVMNLGERRRFYTHGS